MSEEIDGLEDLLFALDDLPVQVERRVLGTAALKAAEVIAVEISARAPRRTGELESSVTWKRGPSGPSEVSAGVAFGRPGKFRWHFVEFGTVKMAAHPFIRPGAAAAAQPATDAFMDYAIPRIEKLAEGYRRRRAAAFG